LALIADDLAGACDAGVQFAQRGFRTVVQLAAVEPAEFQADLKIINTNSRNDPPRLAGLKVSKALRMLEEEGLELTYKKIDSTLRGNLGIEIKAALGERRLAVVSPAFPAMGRLIMDGHLHVGGVAQRDNHLPTLLRHQSRMAVRHLSGRFVAEGPDALRKRLKGISKQGRTIVGMDTASQAELAVIARAALAVRPAPLVVGSAGLAAEIASLLGAQYRSHSPVAQAPAVYPRGGPVVLIVGSTHRVTRQQLDYLLAHRAATRIPLRGDFIRRAYKAIHTNHHVLININLSKPNIEPPAGLTEILADQRVRGIILTGGDTADLVVRALSARGIILAREILPGIPWGRLIGGPADGKPVATKAGGFGKLEALAVMAGYLGRLKL